MPSYKQKQKNRVTRARATSPLDFRPGPAAQAAGPIRHDPRSWSPPKFGLAPYAPGKIRPRSPAFLAPGPGPGKLHRLPRPRKGPAARRNVHRTRTRPRDPRRSPGPAAQGGPCQKRPGGRHRETLHPAAEKPTRSRTSSRSRRRTSSPARPDLQRRPPSSPPGAPQEPPRRPGRPPGEAEPRRTAPAPEDARTRPGARPGMSPAEEPRPRSKQKPRQGAKPRRDLFLIFRISRTGPGPGGIFTSAGGVTVKRSKRGQGGHNISINRHTTSSRGRFYDIFLTFWQKHIYTIISPVNIVILPFCFTFSQKNHLIYIVYYATN